MVSVVIVTHFICVLVLVCFCIIMTMSNWASQFNLQGIRVTILYYIYTIFFLVGLLSTLYSSLRNIRRDIHVRKSCDQQTYLLSIGGMGLFFVGILINDSLNLAGLAYCFPSYVRMPCDMFKITGFIFYHCSKPLYLGAQWTFIIWIRYNRLNLGCALISKLAHSVNIAVNMALVIYCSSYETRFLHQTSLDGNSTAGKWDFFDCNKTGNEIHTTKGEACVSAETALLKLNRSLFPYLFPMQVQFASLAISVMIGQVSTTEAVDDAGSDEENDEEVRPVVQTSVSHAWAHIRTLLPSFLLYKPSQERRSLLPTQQPSAFSPLLLVGIFICSIQIIAGVVGKEDLPGTIWFCIVIDFTWYLSLVVCAICVLKYMCQHMQAVLRTPLPSSAIVILISSACAYNLNFYKLIANADITARPKNDWNTIENRTGLNNMELTWYTCTNAFDYCLCIIRVVLQSLIIIRISRELSMTRYCLPLTGIVRTSLYYLLIANFTSWVWNSVAIGMNGLDPIKVIYYSDNVWQSLQRAFTPGFMYFEFHSFTILAEYMIAQWYHQRQQAPSLNNSVQTRCYGSRERTENHHQS